MAGDGQRPGDRRRHHEFDRQVRVNELKARKNLLVYGSGQLTETLRTAGLIDEYRLLICPIVLGEGRKLFTAAAAGQFTVTDTRSTPSGMALLTLVAA